MPSTEHLNILCVTLVLNSLQWLKITEHID